MRKRQRMDWVYRGWEVLPDDDDFSDHESFGPHIWTCSATNPAAAVLYDSRNYLAQPTGGSGGLMRTIMPMAARAESGRRPKIVRVSGYIFFEPTTWSAGSLIESGFRIGIFEQDSNTGDVITPSINWSLWNVGAVPQEQPAVWANSKRQNLWERRVRRAFSTSNDQASQTIVVNAAIRAYLDENECLAIIAQNSGPSVDTRGTFWLRSLVADHN